MCGFIAGSDLHQTTSLSDVIEKISYRGLPGLKGFEEYGRHQLAHYSLPFVNLNPKVAIQPMHVNSIPSLFVGEIFNYNEISDTKYDTDSRAIHTEYLNHGLDVFHKFDGFWSFVTIKDDSLFAVTDYLAQKPIYYRTDCEVLASEIDVLLTFGKNTRNQLFHSNVMKWGYDPTGNTPWNEIKQVPPGHYYHKGAVIPYWDWSKVKKTNLRDDLKKATSLRLGGQRKLSILLSGGLDSTIIYGLIKELGREVTAIHVENHEHSYAHMVCESLVQVELGGVTDEEAVLIHQTPVDLGSVKPQIAMARKLRELGFHTVLTGDGADELFGGYRRAEDYDSQYSDVFCELPYYHLPRLDRTMMHETIELRSPFLAPAIVAHALEVPYDLRNGEKKVLKNTFKDIVPKEILDRPKHALKTDAIRLYPIQQRAINQTIWDKLYG
jgi:asparagine synthase (glutamine-hydrolysing)